MSTVYVLDKRGKPLMPCSGNNERRPERLPPRPERRGLRLGALMNELREKMAAQAHVSWSGWMEYLFKQCSAAGFGGLLIPKESVVRWNRQCTTPYADLPENEKKSDRVEADRYLAIVATPRRMTPAEVQAHFEWARGQVHPDDWEKWHKSQWGVIQREPSTP